MATLEQLLEGPGLKPPPGVLPNFIDPPSQSAANLACNITCLTVATICVAIRMYTRLVITRSHGWEDYTCVIAWLGLIAYATLMLVPIFNHNAGVHQWDIQIINLIKWTKIANGIEIAYIPIIFITKLSILLLFLRIFVPGNRNRTYWIIQGVILFNFLFYLANLPVEIWPCVPRSKLWTPTEPGHCINNEEVFVAGGTINVVSDFTILLLPIVEVWRLQMATQRKIGVSAVFATGLFGCISSIMHLVTSVASAKSPDKTYYLFPVAMWTIAEIASGIVCGCLITIPHFFRHFAPKIVSKFTSLTRSSSTPQTKTISKPKPAPFRSRFPFPSSFVRSTNKVSDWTSSSAAYDSSPGTTRGDRMSYMELGESHAWQKPAPAMVADGNDNAAVQGKEEWDTKVGSAGAGGSAAGSGRIANARTGVGGGRTNVQSHGSSVYEDDFSGGYR